MGGESNLSSAWLATWVAFYGGSINESAFRIPPISPTMAAVCESFCMTPPTVRVSLFQTTLITTNALAVDRASFAVDWGWFLRPGSPYLLELDKRSNHLNQALKWFREVSSRCSLGDVPPYSWDTERCMERRRLETSQSLGIPDSSKEGV